jgi:transposase
MGSDVSRRPVDWREGRRLRAWELHRLGWTQRAIAAALGVTPGAVGRWMSRAKRGGAAALRRRPAPGPRPRLGAAQRARLPALLARGAEAHGFRGEVWTAPRVAAVIERAFGVRYHPAHVSRLLRAVGWSSQKPVRRASQRDEAAIAAWLAERWPALKKGRHAQGGRSSGSTSPASTSCRAWSAPTPRAGAPRSCASR